MNREANFRQTVKSTRVTDEPMPGEEIKTYGDARRDAILWADEEIKRRERNQLAHDNRQQVELDRLRAELREQIERAEHAEDEATTFVGTIERLRENLRIADDDACGEHARCEHLQATIDRMTKEMAAEREKT